MEAKDKAKDLMQKAYDLDQDNKTPKDVCQNISLMVVNEILENVYYFINHLELDGLPNNFGDEIEYWECVIEEIKK